MSGSVVGYFTPAHAMLGGLVLGTSVVAKLHTTGRVTGISGIAGGLVRGAEGRPLRLAYVSGLLAAGILLRASGYGAFESLPPSLGVFHFAAAGLLVGVGSAMGSGCTSGHGICGLARLSTRSLAHVGCFMAVGALSTALTGVGAAFQAHRPPRESPPGALAPLLMPDGVLLVWAGGLLAVAAAALGAVYLLALSASDRVAGAEGGGTALVAQLEVAAEAAAGLFFGLGLGLSGMTLPSKVVGFLNVAGPAWDPSLALVMGGGLLVAGCGFYAQRNGKGGPACQSKFSLPTATAIDHRLLGGAALFGAGWGIGGMCPGPMLVALASGEAGVWAATLGMCAGWFLHGQLARAFPKVF